MKPGVLCSTQDINQGSKMFLGESEAKHLSVQSVLAVQNLNTNKAQNNIREMEKRIPGGIWGALIV